jgi:hypothetical protein
MGYIFIYYGQSITPPKVRVDPNGWWSGSELHLRAEPDAGSHPAFEGIRNLYEKPLDVTVADMPVCPEAKTVATIPCTHLLSWPEHLANPDDCTCQNKAAGSRKGRHEKKKNFVHVSTSNCMGIVHDGP